MKSRFKRTMIILLSLCTLLSTFSIPTFVNASGVDGSIATMGANPQYAVGQTFGIEVVDADLNTDTNSPQTVQITATNSTTSSSIDMVLVEDGNDSNRFTGFVRIASDPNPNADPKEIIGANGDIITIKYTDDSNSTGSSAERSTSITISDQVGDPAATPNSGVQTNGTPIELASLTDGAVIYYTTDGSEPGRGPNSTYFGTLYTAESKPQVNNNTIIKAIALKDDMADSNVSTFTYFNAMLQGSVNNPDEGITSATGGNVDLMQKFSDHTSPAGSFPIQADGTFVLPALDQGDYAIKANPTLESGYVSSEWTDITVDENGICSPQTVSLSFQAPQINGTLKYPAPDGSDVSNDKFRIEICSTNPEVNYNIQFAVNSQSGQYIVGGLADDSYVLRAVSQDENYTDSSDISFTVSDGEVVGSPSFDLTLTTPQVTGTVMAPTDPHSTVNGGNVDVLDEFEHYLKSVPVGENGIFKIGGLADGTYKIRANPPQSSSYMSSETTVIEIAGGNADIANPELVLQDKVLKLKWANPVEIGSSDLTVRLDNVSLLDLDHLNGLTAEITGEGLFEPLVLNCQEMTGGPWGEEGDFRFQFSQDTSLTIGEFHVTIKNGSDVLPSDSNSFNVIQRLEQIPWAVDLLKYQTDPTTFNVDVEERNGTRLYPWSEGETLTVKVKDCDHNWSEEYSADITVPADKLLSFSIPAKASAEAGRRDIEISRNGQFLARGSFKVGTTSIDRVVSSEGSNEVSVQGTNLETYASPDLHAELWLDGKKAADSNNANIDGEIRFRFEYNMESGIDYTLKMLTGTGEGAVQVTLPSGGVFQASPRLDCVNTVIGLSAGQTISVKESSFAAFSWSSDEDLMVWMNGPGLNNASQTKATGLVVNDGDLVFTVPQALQEGDYSLGIFKGIINLGYAEIIAVNDTSNDVLRGTVNASNGSPAGGGYVNIHKENENWGERATIGHDGKFYMRKSRMAGDGKYLLTAIPGSLSSDATGSFTLNITNDEYAQNDIIIDLNAAQITGTVRAGGIAAGGGYLDVYDNAGQKILGANVAADGTYKIGGLTNGTYYLAAGAPDKLDYFSSWTELKYEGTQATLDLQLSTPQITGTAADPDSNQLKGDEYDVYVRQANMPNPGYEAKTHDGKFILGNLKPGTYYVALAPRGGSAYTRSDEAAVTIGQNGNATPNSLALKLTSPKLAGTVFDKAGQPLGADNRCCVEIYSGRPGSLNYICWVPVASDGTYGIGGLPDGDYYIRAGVGNDSPLYFANSNSAFTKVTLGTTPTQDLTLTDRAVTRVESVNDVETGSDRITVRVMNFSGKDMNLFSAEVLASNGSELNPRLVIPGDHINLAWNDTNSDEADFELFVDGNVNLASGDYKMKLTYDGSDAAYDNQGFRIFYPLAVVPKGIKPAGTQGMPLKLYVDDRQGGAATGLWASDDTLSVKLITTDGKEYSIDNAKLTKNSDSTISTNVPSPLDGGALPEGWNRIELYKNEALLAAGGIIVGDPVVDRVNYANEGDNRVSLEGQYLAACEKPDTKGEILDTSDNVKWTSTGPNFMWERLEFDFGNVQLPAGKYKFRLTVDGSVVTTKDFNVVPRLSCSPHAVTGDTPASVKIMNNSYLPDFRWADTDVSHFRANISTDGFWYEVNPADGLALDGGNLVVPIKEGEGHGWPLPEGNYRIEVYNNEAKIGYADFVIGQDIITGTVAKSDGITVVGNAKVRITNLHENDNSSMTFTTDSEGKFYVSLKDMPRNDEGNLSGNYSFLVMPPNGCEEAASLITINIDAATTNDISLKLAVPQISGVVKAGTKIVGGGSIEVQKQDGANWKYLFDTDVNEDGTFRIGSLEEGTCYIKAHIPYGIDEQYVSSKFYKVVLGSSPVTGLELALYPIQIGGTVKDGAGNLLRGDQYQLVLRSLDAEDSSSIIKEIRAEDGKYLIGGLFPGDYAVSIRPNGGSAYSQSEEVLFTVKEDRTVENGTVNLQLTSPKLTGTVVYDTDQPFTKGYVDVFNGTWQRMNYITTAELDEQGRFRIGGLPNGTYYIRAALWDDADLRSSYSQSVMTEITLGTTSTVQLELKGKAPRIRRVDNARIGDSKLYVRLVNIDGLDLSKFSAEIVNADGNSFETPMVISGAENFFTDGGYDPSKDEGGLLININGGIKLAYGGYKLKLKYNGTDVENETPEVNGFNGFNIVYNLFINPPDVLTGTAKTLELNLDMNKADYPWTSADSVVKLVKRDSSVVELSKAIAEDRTLEVSLPALATGIYTIQVYKNSVLLAESDMSVGYPSMDEVQDISEDNTDIHIHGRNLAIYLDGTATARIYNADGTVLKYTATDLQFMFGDIVVSLDGKPLPVGQYKLVLTYKNGMAVDMPNDGKFRVVDLLYTTPSYMRSGQPSQTLTLRAAPGKTAPWNSGDTIEINLNGDTDNGKGENYTVKPASLSADSITLDLPAMNHEGHVSVTVYRISSGNREYIGYAHFYSTWNVQLTGTVLDGSGHPVPYAFVYLRKKGDDNWGRGFDADSNGKYGVYGIEPSEYTVFAAPPKGATFVDSAGFDITINGDGTCSASTHDFDLQPGRRISGKVSLPGSEKAPASGLNLKLGVWTDKGTPDYKDDDRWYGTDLFIPEGQSYATYSVIVPVSNDNYFVGLWPEASSGFVNTGMLYSSGGTVFTLGQADKLNVTLQDKSNIDITLAHGTRVSGTVRLPAGTAPNDIWFDVVFTADKGTEDSQDDLDAGYRLCIPQGQSSNTYELYLPAASGYRVEYKGAYEDAYIDNGFYKTAAVTTYDIQQSTKIDVGTSAVSNINMMLIPAKLIKGTISVPVGMTVPSNGISGWIGACADKGTADEKDDYWRGFNFTIDPDKTSIGYVISVPADLNDYTVRLWSDAPGSVNCATFYSESGSVFTYDAATHLSFDTAEKSGIDITLAKGKAITGTMTLPAADPEGGRGMNVQAVMDNGTPDNKYDDIVADAKVLIPAGQTSTTYTIIVPASAGYKIGYIADPAYGYIEKGYYKSADVTTYDINQSTAVDGSADISGIDLTVIPAKYIKGTVHLPAGQTAPASSVAGWIGASSDMGTANDKSDDYWAGTEFKIASGGNSVNYTIAVPATLSNFTVQLWSDGAGYINGATYYSTTTGTGYALTQQDATVLPLGSTETAGIDITMVKGKTITGTMILPAAAPEGGRGMSIHAIMDNGTPDNKNDDIVADAKVLIPAGQTSATYTIVVPSASGYKVQYVADPAYGYEERGFYLDATHTVFDYSAATPVNATTNVSGINLKASTALAPSCQKAETTEDGTAVQLYFSKPLKALPAAPSGFSLTVGGTPYEIDGAALDNNGTMVTLHIKDYKIFKDHTNIEISYTQGSVASYDNQLLENFSKSVTNKSARTVSILKGFVNSALLNKDAVFSITTSGEAVTVKDGTNTITPVANSYVVSAEGAHTVTVSVTGRKTYLEISFTIDKTAPTVTITNAASVKNLPEGVKPTITFGGDYILSTQTFTLNGVAYNVTSTDGGKTYTGEAVKAAGRYTLTASAKDAAGNVKSESATFDVVWDTCKPVITTPGIVNKGIYNSTSISINLASDAATTDAGNSNAASYSYKATLKKPDGSTVNFDKNSIPAIMAEGAYRLEITALNPSYTDITSNLVIEFIIDGSAPTAAVTNITDGQKFNTAVTPIISFTDAVASQQTLINNATVTLTRNTVAVPAYRIGDTLSLDGAYVLKVKTQDALHESAEITVNFTIDRTKPVITLSGALNGTTYKDQNVTITAKTNEGTLTVTFVDENGQIVLNGSNQSLVVDGNGQAVLTGADNSLKTYKVTARAVDDHGNVSEQQLIFSIDRLAVNIVVAGVSEGMLVNYNPDISFTTFEGTTEKAGTIVTIDGNAFAGGSYSVHGVHMLAAKYVSGGVTYTKTIHFTIDKTAPALAVAKVFRNGYEASSNIAVKAGDTVKVRATVTDANGIGGASFSIGTAASGIPMQYVAEGGYYEGEYIAGSGNYSNLSITVNVTDKAGNKASQNWSNKVSIDNTKPVVSLVTNPAVADGNNGIFKTAAMTVTLAAGTGETLIWNFNGSANDPGTPVATKSFSPRQGTNILVYHAVDAAGNISDEKVFVFSFDSERPQNVVLDVSAPATTSVGLVSISGTIPGEDAKSGTTVLLKKGTEVIAKAGVKPDNTFVLSGVRLAEGPNTFTLTAIDLAGNESATSTTLTWNLDSTAPILTVNKMDDTHYMVESNENISIPSVKYNGVAVDPANVTADPSNPNKKFNIVSPAPVEGVNTMNASAVDTAGNIGTGSFTSTFIPANTAQNDLQLNDNATMDIPDGAFSTQTQILVKTVDIVGNENYKPLGAAISFEFLDDQNQPVHPANDSPLVVKNFIGTGLTGVTLMHVNGVGEIDSTITALSKTSTEFDMNDPDDITAMPLDTPYYVSDTGYLVFKTTNFSSYQVVQDNTAPRITVSTADYVINKQDYADNGNKITIAGSISDNDTASKITQVLIDGNLIDISGIPAANLGLSFDITLGLTDGTHEVTIKAEDTAGNSSTATKTYYVDVTPPSLTATVPTTNTGNNTIDISINTNENSDVKIDSTSKGSFNGDGILTANLTDGAANTFNITATDAFGNVSVTRTITVTRDSTPPEITIGGVSDEGVYGDKVTIIVNATDAANHLSGPPAITMDGDPYTPGEYSTQGQHTLLVSASDTFGNTSSRSVTFTIDTSVPVINITGAVNDGMYNSAKTLSVTANNIDTLTVTKAVDGQAPQAVSANVDEAAGSGDATVTAGNAGEQHSYKITATARKTVDGVVKTATTTINLTVDLKNPTVTSTTAAQTESATIAITGTVSETADIYLNGIKVIDANPAGAFTISGQSLVLGANTFTVKAVDAAGNQSATITINVTRNQPAGNPGGFPGGFIFLPPVQPDDTAITVTTVSGKNGEATGELKSSALDDAFAQAQTGKDGSKTITVSLKEIKGATEYTMQLPAEFLSSDKADKTLKIQSPLGEIAVPSNMFDSKALSGESKVGILMGIADTTGLSSELKAAIGSKPVIELSATVDGKPVSWSSDNSQVTVSIDYTPTAEELKDPEHITVWYIDGSGRITAIPSGRYDSETGKVIFSTNHFSKYAVAYVKKTFNDISGSYAKDKIEVMASKGIISGTSQTTYSPDLEITRADFISLLVRVLNLKADFTSNFSDVKATDYYYNALGIAKKLGIASGTGNNKFQPKAKISRQDMAALTYRALMIARNSNFRNADSTLPGFADAGAVASYARVSVAVLVNKKIIIRSTNTFKPLENVTRAEMADIIYNIYKVIYK